MDANNPLQQLLLRGLGTGSLVAERLRYVSQEWVRSGKLDPSHASVLVEDVLRALRGETPGLEEQASRQLERNRDQLLQDLGLPQQRELDELRGRIDRLEQALRQRQNGDAGTSSGATPFGAPPNGV
jgi:polyhydroxyalkanoate synthesis regulator phasin